MAMFLPMSQFEVPTTYHRNHNTMEQLFHGHNRRSNNPWVVSPVACEARPLYRFVPRYRRTPYHHPLATLLLDREGAVRHGKLVCKNLDDRIEVSMLLPRGTDPANLKVSLDTRKNLLAISGEAEDQERMLRRSFEQVVRIPCQHFKVDQVTSKLDTTTGRFAVVLPRIEQENKVEEANKEAVANHDEEANVEMTADKTDKSKETGSDDEGFADVDKETEGDSNDMDVDEVTEVEAVQAEDEELKPFTFFLKLNGYQPDHLKVDVLSEEGLVRISGQREELVDDDTSEVKHFVKTVPVDREVFDLRTVATGVNKEGILSIRAERKRSEIQEGKTVRVSFV